MLKNYLLVAVRNILRNKLHFFINVGGLTVALTCSLFILLSVYQHFTFDQSFPNKQQLYKLYSEKTGANGAESSTYMSYPLGMALKSQIPEVVAVAGVYNCGKLVRYKEKVFDLTSTLVDPDFVKVFSLPIKEGNSIDPLNELHNAILTTTTAQKLFGTEDPLGKYIEVRIGTTWTRLQVTAVTADMPVNTSIQFSLLARMEIHPDYAEEKNEWGAIQHKVYVQLNSNANLRQVEEKIGTLVQRYQKTDVKQETSLGYVPDKNGHYTGYHLLPLTQEHFTPSLGSNNPVNKALLYVLVLIGSVVLLIACFNFVNLTISKSYQRAREIGVRKCLGAGKRQIWLQVWGESVIMVTLALLLAIISVIILIPQFNRLFDNNLEAALLIQPRVVLLMVGLLIVVSFISSGYPSGILAKLKVTEVLKGKMAVNKPGAVRNSLIVVQFAIAIILMVCTAVIVQQFNYLRSAPLGYNTKAVISIPLKDEENGRALVRQLRTQLANQPAVLAVSGSDANIGLGEDKADNSCIVCMVSMGNSVCGQTIYADDDFLKALDIKAVSGSDFNGIDANDTTHLQAIFSAGYAKLFGRTDISAGSTYQQNSGDTKVWVNIVGVIPDLLLQSLKSTQYPLVIYNSPRHKTLNYALVKVNTTNPAATMQMIKKAYAVVEPGAEFKGSYLNENIDRLYRSEQVQANLLTVVAGIAIVLSCLGLLGIASIVIGQRTKEIGVRKVLGASVNSIVLLVCKAFIKPIIISFLIAVPVAWYCGHTWLQDYSYRITLHWWVFVLPGVLTLFITMGTIGVQSVKTAIMNPVNSLKSE